MKHDGSLLGGEVKIVESMKRSLVTGDKVSGEYTFIRELKLGGITLSNLAVVFADAQLDDKPTLLLGMNAMRAFKKVSIDFANRKFRVLLPEHSAIDTDFAAGRLGRETSTPTGCKRGR